MSLHENTRRPVETLQALSTANTQSHRLYPSLPNTDRYDVCVLDTYIGKKLPTSSDLRGDAQSEAPVASGDVRMKAQILILEEQRQELLSINERWAQEYRTMSKYYKERVQTLKSSLQHENSHLEVEMCLAGEKNMALQKCSKDKENTWTGDGDVRLELLNAEEEVKELRAHNSKLSRRGKHQHEEIQRLNKALDEALQNTQPLDLSCETLQDIWKHQAEVYKEDFEKERGDREKLKGKYLDLEKKFRKAHSELRVLKPQVTWARPTQPLLECHCGIQAECQNWEVRQINQNHVQFQRRYTLDNKL